MAKLATPAETIKVLKKYDFIFQKRFGQNFLIDSHVLDKIVAAAEIGPEDYVLEIGPGIGTMTQYLAEAARKVTAIEIDHKLIPILEDTLSEYPNVNVVQGDVLKLDLRELVDRYREGRPVKVVANLPYYITSPVIMGLFEGDLPLHSVTVMVQKEVARRMQAEPGSKDYGALSLAVRYHASPYIAANVPPNCFMPRPNVGSAVIRLTCHQTPPVQVKDSSLMFRLIRAAFNQRRKTLANSLQNSPDLQIAREKTCGALEEMGLSVSVRGEKLSLDQFARLSDLLGQKHFDKPE